MKVSIFSKVSVIFFVAFLFVNNVFCAEEELPQRVVYVNGSHLLPLIRGYKKVMADISSIHEQKKLELQKEYSEVATVQGELDELRKLIRGHEDDPDFVDPATGETLSDIQRKISDKNSFVTKFQENVQRVQDEMEDVKNNLLAPIRARYKSILEAFIREKKQNERISYIIFDKKDVVCADLAFDITNIIEARIKDDNERRARNRRNNAAGEPIINAAGEPISGQE
jgi:Skp family chaperone for outer membrane proteins